MLMRQLRRRHLQQDLHPPFDGCVMVAPYGVGTEQLHSEAAVLRTCVLCRPPAHNVQLHSGPVKECCHVQLLGARLHGTMRCQGSISSDSGGVEVVPGQAHRCRGSPGA
jgi:hypothetical protein